MPTDCEITSDSIYGKAVDLKAVNEWFDKNQRQLPWRDSDCSSWGILVSEVMLQQTPVSRVEPVWASWMTKWPTSTSLANALQADAVKEWGDLGFPRRAMYLHKTAISLEKNFGGSVPQDFESLIQLPGIGDYTARAIRAFAFGIPESVVDTNIRRVIARAEFGAAQAGAPRLNADRKAVNAVLRGFDDRSQVLGAKALMELGALVCRARIPACDECPIRNKCSWRIKGYPEFEGSKRQSPNPYVGSDRQVRGLLVRTLQNQVGPMPERMLLNLWRDQTQASRALESLLKDGLASRSPGGVHLTR